MLVTRESFTFSHPSSHELSVCGVSIDYTVSSIPKSTDWLVSFLLQSAVEYVSATSIQLEAIVSRFDLKLADWLTVKTVTIKIGAREGHIDIIRKGYKPIWIRSAPQERITLLNPTISTNASYVLYTEVVGFLERGVICEVGWVQESMLIHTFST